MRLPKLDITTGDAVKVILGAERIVAAPDGPVRVKNITRFVLAQADGGEREFAVYDLTAAIWKDHRVSIVYGRPNGAKDDILLRIQNHDTGQRYEPAGAMERMTALGGLDARLKAIGGGVVAGVIVFATLSLTGQPALWASVVTAGAAFFLLWLAIAGFDATVLPARRRALAHALLNEIETRLGRLDRGTGDASGT